jgi:Resolvase, N terminal domain
MRKPRTKRVAIYARVSTDDKGQGPEIQLLQLLQWCADAGYQLVGEYVDRVSGRRGPGGFKDDGPPIPLRAHRPCRSPKSLSTALAVLVPATKPRLTGERRQWQRY